MAAPPRLQVIARMAVVTGALLMISTPGFAQDETQQTPPSRDIVLNPTDQTTRRDGFVLTAAVFGGFDKRTQPGAPGTSRVVTAGPAADTQNGLPSGLHSGASAGLDFGRDRAGSSIWVHGQTSTTYFPSLGRRLTTADASASAQKQIGRHTRLGFSPSVSYAPYWGLDLFGPLSAVGADGPLLVQAPSLNSAVVAAPTYRYAFDASVTEDISARTSLVFRATTQGAQVPDRNTRLAYQSVGGRLTHAVSSHVALNLGYTYLKADYAASATSAPVGVHDLDIGAIYHRNLSFSRKTSFSFVTGSSLLSQGGNATLQTPRGIDFRLRVNADLDHQIGQTWSARLGYQRHWMFVEGFAGPFFVDDVSFNMGGRLNHRVTLSTRLAYLHGSIGQGTQGSVHSSYNGAAMLRMSLNRSVSAFGQYQYARFSFSNATVLQDGFPRFFERSGVRGGLTLVLPPPKPASTHVDDEVSK